LREKTLLVGVGVLIRRIDLFFLDLSCVVCEHPWRNLKLNGVLGFYKLFKNLKRCIKTKAPPLKPKYKCGEHF
jgi:hypothetical protein